MTSDEEWILAHEERILSALHSTGVILELGCGIGRDTKYLEQMGQVVAIDLSTNSLRTCSLHAPLAILVQTDLGKGIPIADGASDVVVASLSLHYFDWLTTVRLAGEVYRCIRQDGLLIARLNSVNDIHFGAGSDDILEPNYFRIGKRRKRFFDRMTVLEMFKGWQIDHVEEKQILRYDKPKWVWEVLARAAA